LLKGFERIGVVAHLREEEEFARHRMAPVARRFYSRINANHGHVRNRSACDVPIGGKTYSTARLIHKLMFI
jgi:hypothetical protein